MPARGRRRLFYQVLPAPSLLMLKRDAAFQYRYAACADFRRFTLRVCLNQTPSSATFAARRPAQRKRHAQRGAFVTIQRAARRREMTQPAGSNAAR